MVFSHPFPPRRKNLSRPSQQPSFGLPSYASAVQEKMRLEATKGSWLIPLSMPVPGSQTRRVRLRMINSAHVPRLRLSRLGRRRGFMCRCLTLLASLFAIWAVVMIFGMEDPHWTPPFRDSTLVFGRENLQRIWKWEIESGHYPSSRKIPEQIGLSSIILNPALPPAKAHTFVSPFTPPAGPVATVTLGNGPRRRYLDIENQTTGLPYPPRPVSGSVADLDIIFDQCSFSENRYVRDCLEFLRAGAGLDNGRKVRRGRMDEWKYIFVQEESRPEELAPLPLSEGVAPRVYPTGRLNFDAGLSKKRGIHWEPPLSLPPLSHHPISSSPQTACDPEHPRIFHIFWANRPFDDKPYVALLSFLYTQNLGLHLENSREAQVCRPQIWLWINLGPAASIPNPSALDEMYQGLKTNPWAAPFLHPRFKDVIKFKIWNTTEQLDGVPELKDEWRKFGHHFTSGGYSVNLPVDKNSTKSDASKHNGPETETSYDRLSVILSDMARFVLCHRFGGIYLDADTIFLRDWEELWGWNGAFAYRWSYHDDYNTAVLHMNKNSALGSFLFKTALKNGLDFHPVTVTRYLKEAHLENLLSRIPDALFDPAWLNTEGLQLDRPTQPNFLDFGEFFQTPALSSASPQASGFEGFFRGAFSYHFHNSWWKAFDPSRNWADLGPIFAAGEKAGRALANPNIDPDDWVDKVSDDKRDLDWATVLKRTFESYVRGERPNMYGEWLQW
ncbi:hypothetical protein BJ138DRAFT_51056 [Hygrophoropsis aurantiaca]|uniref:Uncharacterized protein n=1 Tax=Hygrophoropsis aurantiaca TaxID=72124 RepID=A0ACB8AC21_9AGAM|nr:hypothetical protein BJ138DRAFT_51056 [Hygrophoropsis aurantiaca]